MCLFLKMEKQSNLLGLHKLLTLQVSNQNKLVDLLTFVNFTDKLLVKYHLEKVGNTSFVFENGSFTIAYCLKESHICVHTWPEINKLTMDVYLCNYSTDNTNKVREISEEIVDFFEAKIISSNEIFR